MKYRSVIFNTSIVRNTASATRALDSSLGRGAGKVLAHAFPASIYGHRFNACIPNKA